VAQAAIQGLNKKLHEKDAEIQALEMKLDELQATVKQLVAPSSGACNASRR
jgi:prefoldin subunit 5